MGEVRKMNDLNDVIYSAISCSPATQFAVSYAWLSLSCRSKQASKTTCSRQCDYFS